MTNVQSSLLLLFGGLIRYCTVHRVLPFYGLAASKSVRQYGL